jgi:uncharacterized membrane protein YiaA
VQYRISLDESGYVVEALVFGAWEAVASYSTLREAEEGIELLQWRGAE